MPLAERARRWVALILSPETCIICGTESWTGRPLCAACEASWLFGRVTGLSPGMTIEERCSRCGRPLVSAIGECVECREIARLSAIDGIIPLLPYTADAQALLTAWKVRGLRSLTVPFAQCLARVLAAASATALVPVPPRPGKIRAKGWDQIEDLCRFLEKRQGLRVVRCLERRSLTPQKKLGRIARAENMRSGFAVRPHAGVPETAIVIDDLMTTGATLDACAEALKTAGTRTVYGLTLFYD